MRTTKPRLATALALAAALGTAACQNPDGSTNWGNTLALGAGVGLAGAALAAAASDNGDRGGRHGRAYRGDRRVPNYGYRNSVGYGDGRYASGYGRGGYGGGHGYYDRGWR